MPVGEGVGSGVALLEEDALPVTEALAPVLKEAVGVAEGVLLALALALCVAVAVAVDEGVSVGELVALGFPREWGLAAVRGGGDVSTASAWIVDNLDALSMGMGSPADLLEEDEEYVIV